MKILLVLCVFLMGCTSTGTFTNINGETRKAKINGNAESEYTVKYKDGKIVEEKYKIKRTPIIDLKMPDIKIDRLGD